MSDGESDQERTRFEYGEGGVPLFVGIVWILFILTYLGVMVAVALPDFLSWVRQ